MQYFISFLEGIITFISPCLLPMLPIYISYFAGGGERTTKKTLSGALGFVLGFTLVFMAMGAAITYGVTSIPVTYFLDGDRNAIAYGAGAMDAATLQTGIDMIYTP